jgi:hypothetical protein
MTTSKLPISNPDFNTLLLSFDSDLYKQITEYLNQNDGGRTLKCSHDISEVQPVELWLGKCDIMICDLRSDGSLLETSSILIESAPTQLLAIGLCNGTDVSEQVLTSPAGLRLTDIVNIQDGWKGIWRHISSIKNAWANPLMVSKIEDVPVSDILQMISIGRWNSMVQIQGRTTMSKELTARTAGHIRGCIFFWKGEPIAAWSSNHTGVQAICDLLSLKQGILKVIRPLKTPPFRNIQTDMQDILISYAVTLDESFNDPMRRSTALDEAIDASLKSTPNPEADAQPDKKNIRSRTIDPLRPHDSPPLHAFWTQCVPIGESLIKSDPRSLPLRWMKPGDLQKLVLPEKQSLFLVMRAPRKFLLDILGLCAREYSDEKLDDGSIPVLRLGRQGKNYLYMAYLDTNADCPALNAFPCAVYTSFDQAAKTLQSLAKCGHPVTVLLVPDTHAAMLDQLIGENLASIQQCLPAPTLHWESITMTITDILRILSALAPGDET